MTDRWMLALLLIAAGVVLGALAGWLVRRRLAKATDGATTSVAGVAGLFVFWLFIAVGASVALAATNPETLEDLPRQILDYLPRVLAGGLILIAGYALAIAASRFVSFGLERASGSVRIRVASAVRWAIVFAATILALAQLGVDTTILLVVVAVIGLAFALAFGLLVGLGGQNTARELASGRYVKRLVKVGMTVSTAHISGRVASLAPATVEIITEDGTHNHLPYSQLMHEGFAIRPATKE